jgi:cytochrome c biogenesis protein CcdA/HEAT repeat protein
VLRLSSSLLLAIFFLIGGDSLAANGDLADALKSKPSPETLAAALPLLADPAQRNQIRSTIQDLKPFPAKDLAALLSHSQLAVRLGALEILEEKAGGDFGYNPWTQPTHPDNEAPLALWKKWSQSTAESPQKSSRLLSEEQRHAYLRDLLSDDSNKSARARRMLEADGLSSVGFLEAFLNESATLPAGSRAKVREAQYQIVLGPAFGPQAPNLARNLAFGSRDQILTALANLKSAGLGALPIIRDFLQHPDPLVRETAIDSILLSGGSEALEIVAPILAQETDPNVIHGALRRIKEIPGDTSLSIATSFLSRDEEDLLISAIQACQKLVAGSTNSMSFMSGERTSSDSNESPDKQKANTSIIEKLADPRWRVRTAALEYIAAARVKAAAAKCVELIQDPDEFVRFSAIKAATALGAQDASPVLRKMFFADPANVASVLQGYTALGSIPDDEMMEKLASYPPDACIAAIETASSESRLSFILLRFASDPDLDVACAALRHLASSYSNNQSPKSATVLVEALRTNSPEKRTAILDQITLPKSSYSSSIDPALLGNITEYTTPAEKTELDPLYDSLLTAAGKATAASASDGVTTIPGAHGELINEIKKIAQADDSNAFRAALSLSITGDTAALNVLLKNLDSYSTAQRAAIAAKLYQPTSKQALEILTKLVRDPVEEIRAQAVETVFSTENIPAFLTMALNALSEPDTSLTASQFYTYYFESALRNGGITTRAITNWANKTLDEPDSSTPNRVLALLALRNSLSGASIDKVLTLAKSSPDKWIRRAAWYSYGSSSPNGLATNASSLAKDDSPFVRAVLPALLTRMRNSWSHQFSDTISKSDSSWSHDNESRRLPSEAATILESLAATDPSPDIRFQAMATLLSHGRTIDVESFATLLRARPKDEGASNMVASWMSENLGRLGPGLAPIVSALDPSSVSQNYMAAILTKVSPPNEKGPGFASFAALAANAETLENAPQQLTPTEPDKPEKITRESLPLIYFYKPGCNECEKAARLLDVIKADFPLLQVTRHNINENSGTLLNQALCARFNVPSLEHNIAPAIFTQTGYLIRAKIDAPSLGTLLTSTMATSQDDSWSKIEQAELDQAREKVEDNYAKLTLTIVLIAGLIDGVNPCAFATIIFFLSYLQIARRTPREMFMVGASFISAVFIAYFAAGLILHSVLESITSKVSGIKPFLDWIFAALALLAALLSFRDAAKAKAGKLDEMTLTLPAFLKDRIRTVIRTGTKARRFVIAAFIAGIIISFLELACTGQVYAPIIYSIQQGKMDAVAWLLAYNLAFISPLVFIFALTFSGMSSKALINFQLKHTFSVKIALGLLFLTLAAFIILAPKWLYTAAH